MTDYDTHKLRTRSMVLRFSKFSRAGYKAWILCDRAWEAHALSARRWEEWVHLARLILDEEKATGAPPPPRGVMAEHEDALLKRKVRELDRRVTRIERLLERQQGR